MTAVYTTRRELLIKERESLMQAYTDALTAQGNLITGKISSYSLGQWSISRSTPDLEKLAKWLDQTRLRLAEIDNILTGRPVRKSSVCVYQTPQHVRYWS